MKGRAIKTEYFFHTDIKFQSDGVKLTEDQQYSIDQADVVIYQDSLFRTYIIKNIFGPSVEWPTLITPPDTKKGYHLSEIPKGEYGEASKIEEEFKEFKDALLQGSGVMQLVELCDLYGAIEAFVDQKFKMDISEIQQFSDITKRAFRNGSRS